jgi:hypothetical protein
MSKERYNQIVDEVYKNYLNETMFSSDPTWLEPIPVMDMKTGEKSMGARQYHKEAFLNKCKTNKEFSERWGLKIEERELEQRERVKLLQKAWKNNGISPEHEEVSTMWIEYKNLMEKYNIPIKLITVTYNNETIEIYE